MAKAESTTQLDILGILFSGRSLRTVSSYEQNDMQKKMEQILRKQMVLELRAKSSVTENEKYIATENQNLKAEIQTLHDAYGMTGENISRKIFSYLDIFSLMRGRRVSKIWNRYLSQQKCIWMAHLRKTLSFLDYFEEMAQDIRMLFDSLEENGKVEDMICVFQKIQCLAFFNYHASNHAMSLNFGFYFAFEVPNFGNPEIFLWKDIALKKQVDKFVDKHVDALKRPGISSIDRSVLMRIRSFDGDTASACSLMKDYCKDVQKKHLEKLVLYLQWACFNPKFTELELAIIEHFDTMYL